MVNLKLGESFQGFSVCRWLIVLVLVLVLVSRSEPSGRLLLFLFLTARRPRKAVLQI